MVFEIVGSRIISPYLGSSTVTWTAIIGSILTFMSLGYWYGGRKADENESFEYLQNVLLTIGVLLLGMNLTKGIVLEFISNYSNNLIFKSLVSSILLFGGPSFLLAFVSPYAIRLCLRSADESGRVSGKIYAISTLGSILGTFMSGFFLIAWIGTNNLVWLLAILISIAAFMVKPKVPLTLLIVFAILLVGNIYRASAANEFIDIDTNYNRVYIYDQVYDGEEVRDLYLNGDLHSRINRNDPTILAHGYGYYFDLFDFYRPNSKDVCMLGGGAFAYPQHFLSIFPDKRIDVVEIDDGLTAIAEEYFMLQQNDRLKIFNEDARTFVNDCSESYEVVLYDIANTRRSVPFYMTTKEAFSSISDMLVEDGIMISNFIASTKGGHGKYLSSVTKTLIEIFKDVRVYQTSDFPVGNFIVVAGKMNLPEDPPFHPKVDLSERIEPQKWNGLTLRDNFAPVNYMMAYE
jgi:predicted membrane-bound spermidine synthase